MFRGHECDKNERKEEQAMCPTKTYFKDEQIVKKETIQTNKQEPKIETTTTNGQNISPPNESSKPNNFGEDQSKESYFNWEYKLNKKGEVYVSPHKLGKLEEKRETGENILSCNVCQGILPSEASLEVHMKIHALDQQLDCKKSECDKKFSTQRLLWDHMLTKHGETKDNYMNKRIKCDSCDKVFDNPSRLRWHMMKHSETKNFHCDLCPKRFKRVQTLRIHTKSHLEIYDYVCTDCGKKYLSTSALHNHKMTQHAPEHVFSCDECGKMYPNKGRLSVHMTFHTGEKTFKCREGCDKTFRLFNSRKNHERSHRGVKEFQCSRCAKMFMKEFQCSRCAK